jgi:hypothetical protein
MRFSTGIRRGKINLYYIFYEDNVCEEHFSNIYDNYLQ